jgi:hypothetical protein
LFCSECIGLIFRFWQQVKKLVNKLLCGQSLLIPTFKISWLIANYCRLNSTTASLLDIHKVFPLSWPLTPPNFYFKFKLRVIWENDLPHFNTFTFPNLAECSTPVWHNDIPQFISITYPSLTQWHTPVWHNNVPQFNSMTYPNLM